MCIAFFSYEPIPRLAMESTPPQKNLGVLRITGRAFAATWRHIFPLLVLAIFLAVPATFLRQQAFVWFQQFSTGWLPTHGVIIDPQQVTILAMALADLPVMVWASLAGALTAAAVIRIYLQDENGQPVTMSDTINFALSRWKRVVWPYTAATLIIWLGSIVIIPGILYTLFYAFVAPVTVLDRGVKRPLDRSRKLTWGRRGRIFRTFLLFIPWWGWYATLGPLILMEKPLALQAGTAVINELLGFVIAMAVLQLYLERIQQLEELMEERRSRKPGVS